MITLWILEVELWKTGKAGEGRVAQRLKRNWCPKLRVFEGMTQPLIQVFKYLMREGIKRDRSSRLGIECQVGNLLQRTFVCLCVCVCV